MSSTNLIWYLPLSLFTIAFVNVLADNLPYRSRFSFPGRCNHCSVKLGLDEMVRNKPCKNCGINYLTKKKIPILILIITYVLISIKPPTFSGIFFTFILLTLLSLVVLIDLVHMIIPTSVNIISGLIFLLIGFSLNGFKSTILGGVVGGLIMLGLFFGGKFYIQLINRCNKNEFLEDDALGFGDVFLTANLGFYFAYPRIILLIFLTIITAGLFCIFFVLIKKITKNYERYSMIPFSPFIVFSSIILVYLAKY